MKKALLLNIALKEVKPKVWRKVWIESDISFLELHIIIQLAMDWDNYHLFEFAAGRHRIGVMNDYSDGSMLDAERISVGEYLTAKGKKINYIYDFGDYWEHIVRVEEVAAIDPKITYPYCISGKNCCPPEDCGGPWGYEGLLETIRDKKHPEHESMMEWLGDDFDPTFFDLEDINLELEEFCRMDAGGPMMDQEEMHPMHAFFETMMEHLPQDLIPENGRINDEQAQDILMQMLSGEGGGELKDMMMKLFSENNDQLYNKDGSVNESFVDQGMADAMGVSVDEKPEAYEGYTVLEMNQILYRLFEKDCPVQFQQMKDEDYLNIPMLNQIKYLIKIIQREKDESLKLTTKGNLPVKVVKEIYAQGFITDYRIENGYSSVYREEKIKSIHLAKLLLDLSGITKKRNGKLSLTKKGEKIAKDDHTLLMTILETFVGQYNWGYFDGYNVGSLDQEGFGFTLVLLSRYGHERKDAEFYAMKFIKASGNYIAMDNRLVASYILRTFERFLSFFNLVDVENKDEVFETKYLTKTALFDKLVRVVPPKMRVVR